MALDCASPPGVSRSLCLGFSLHGSASCFVTVPYLRILGGSFFLFGLVFEWRYLVVDRQKLQTREFYSCIETSFYCAIVKGDLENHSYIFRVSF